VGTQLVALDGGRDGVSNLVLHALAMRRYNRRAEAVLGRDYVVPPAESLALKRTMMRVGYEVSSLPSYLPDPPLPLPWKPRKYSMMPSVS